MEKYAEEAVIATTEKFIFGCNPLSSMTKDSELVREVEDFLKSKGIDVLEMEYNRDSAHYMKPTFSITTNDYNSLEKLATERKAKIIRSYDERSYYKTARITNDKYDIHITVRDKPF